MSIDILRFRCNFISFAIVVALAGCSNPNAQEAENDSWNSLDSAITGIHFENTLFFDPNMNIIEYLYYYNGGGVAIGDINNDGLEDIYFTANQTQDRLYLNEGDLKFTEVTKVAGIEIDSTWSTGVTMDDINGDGFMDIYVCKLGARCSSNIHNLLYINNGDGTFRERSHEMGLNFKGYSTQASFFDFDKDGDLDVYLLNHSSHSIRSYGNIEKRYIKDSLSGDLLFENRLNEVENKFVDVTESAGIYSSALGYGLCLATSDINDDGWIDIYVGNDFHENDYLYLNNGDGTFHEAIANTLSSTTQFTMGVDIGDLNNDGLVDIFTTDMMPDDPETLLRSGGEDTDQVSAIKGDFGFEKQYARNHLHVTSEDQSFHEIALATNTYATDWSWSALIQDFDNNGLNDIFVTNGIVKRPNDLDYINFINQAELAKYSGDQRNDVYKEAIEKMPTMKLTNIGFYQVSSDGSISFHKNLIGSPSYSNGASYADLDKDGDLDLVINNINDNATLLENKNPEQNNSVSIHLIDKSNSTKGANVYLHVDGIRLFKEYTTVRGFQSSSSHFLHFGIGKNNSVDSIRIVWPDGTQQVERSIVVNEHQNFLKSSTDAHWTKVDLVSESDYKLSVFKYKHSENTFVDFDDENLIPEKLSREGPSLVISDFNSDGRDDIFIGGSVYQEAQIYIAENNGSFTPKKITDFKTDATYEDVSAVSFDFEGDGDLDLYVVSGGSDKKELDKSLEDRLYLNDGKANFKRHKISLPHTNGSVVVASDFDNDGYKDLFVGARSIPGSYGLSPYSFILKNVEGQFFDLAFKERFGMVTDAQWQDLNADGFPDLVMVGDWMPITIYMNSGKGDFINKTKELGFENSNGLWNCIGFDDLNEDGEIDIVAGNVGENFKWKASPSEPVTMYLHDYNMSGQIEPIIFYNYNGSVIPFAPRDQLAGSIPSIKKSFPSYQAFSEVRNLETLTGYKEDDIIETKKLTELRSMSYVSSSDGYKGVPLDFRAQQSVIQDVLITSYDGKRELYFVGNHKEFSQSLGASLSNSGGVLSDFDITSGKFKSYKTIPLPKGCNTRSISRLGDNKFFVSVNNDEQLILEKGR